MGMDLGVKTFHTEPEYFEAGTYPIAKAVKTAAEEIPAHAPVVLNADGKLALLKAGDDGAATDGLYGITPDSIKKDEDGPVYLTGEFFADSLALPDGITAESIEIALRGIGIFLK